MNHDYLGPDLEKISKHHPDASYIASRFNEDGYVVVNLNISAELMNTAIDDVLYLVQSGAAKMNPQIYHYNDSPRVVEAWKRSESVRLLALNPKVSALLEILYDSKPLPFSTINFVKSTEQPLHSDYMHFGSLPEFYLAGVWIALEDISEDCGPLTVVKGSHRTPMMSFQDLGFNELPTSTKKVKEYYTRYEEWLVDYVKENRLEVDTPLLKAGEALIWAANLFHGAKKRKNTALTRHSQVTHYHFAGCHKFYNPNFSDRRVGKYANRDVLRELIT